MPYDEDEEKPVKKKRRFRLFDFERDGKGVNKEDIYTKHDLKGFFISLKLRFSQLISVNILMILGNFPIFFAILGFSGLLRYQYMAPHEDLFMNVGGLLLDNGGASGLSQVLRALFATQTEASVMTTANWVFLGLSLLTLFTFGLVNVGTTYLLREMVRGNPVFIWDDFRHAVKVNKKQGFFFGIFDGILLILIPYNLVFFFMQSGFLMSFLFWTMLMISIIYFFMRFYIYLQIVTFDLPMKKILKNSLIFAILNAKRNFMALLGIAVCVLIDFMCFFVAFTIPLAIAIPLVILFALGAFMGMYAAFFKVDEIMVDHSEDENDGTPVPAE